MIRYVLIGLMLASVLVSCQSTKPQLREAQTPDYMVRSYNPESGIRVDYYFQRTYDIKKDGEPMTVVEYIDYDSVLYLPADTVDFIMTIRVQNPKEVLLAVWKHFEVEKYRTFTLIEHNTNYQLIYEGRLPTRSYQMALPVKEDHLYKMFIELRKGGEKNNLVLKTFEVNYRKEK